MFPLGHPLLRGSKHRRGENAACKGTDFEPLGTFRMPCNFDQLLGRHLEVDMEEAEEEVRWPRATRGLPLGDLVQTAVGPIRCAIGGSHPLVGSSFGTCSLCWP